MMKPTLLKHCKIRPQGPLKPLCKKYDPPSYRLELGGITGTCIVRMPQNDVGIPMNTLGWTPRPKPKKKPLKPLRGTQKVATIHGNPLTEQGHSQPIHSHQNYL